MGDKWKSELVIDEVPEPDKDLVHVTRCKNCKHYSDNLNDISGVCHYEIMARIRAPEDYCSKGVRKDNKKKDI